MSLPSRVILDTGPLFDFLLAAFWIHRYKKMPYNKMRYATDSNRWIKLRDYFLECYIYTTPSVIVEINYQARKQMPKREIGIFWEFAHYILKNKGLDEKFIKLLNMSPSEIAKFGPVDISIIELARKINIPIFTADSSLYFYCRNKKIKTLFIYQVLEGILI